VPNTQFNSIHMYL